jgi:hypothetical protein
MPILTLSDAKPPFPECFHGMKRHIFTFIYLCVCVCVCVRARARVKEDSIAPNEKTMDISVIRNVKHGSK